MTMPETPGTPEPLDDDPTELEELRRIEQLNTLTDFAHNLMEHGMTEIHAWRVMFKCLRLIRRGV